MADAATDRQAVTLPITTRSTRERVIRNSLVAVMLLAYAGWSFYDGYVGYPEDNLASASQELPADAQASATINPQITEANLRRLGEEDQLKKGTRLAEAEELLGPSSWKGALNGDVNSAYWFGPGGTLILRYNSINILSHQAQFKPSKHTEKDLMLQKGMGAVVGALGLYALIRVILMLATSVRLSEEGLKTPGGAQVPFESMSGWDASDYKDKGRIDLEFESGGRKKTFVLDDYKIAAYKPIVNEICRRKGFENPFDQVEPESKQPEPAT